MRVDVFGLQEYSVWLNIILLTYKLGNWGSERLTNVLKLPELARDIIYIFLTLLFSHTHCHLLLLLKSKFLLKPHWFFKFYLLLPHQVHFQLYNRTEISRNYYQSRGMYLFGVNG